MTRPSPARLFRALDLTWPAVTMERLGPWTIRRGDGGGQRVSAATAEDRISDGDVTRAEKAMLALGQRPLFMIREGDDDLDRELAERGYEIVDPVAVYLAASRDLTADVPVTKAFPSWPPLAVQLEIWAAAGIGPARLSIMDRCPLPKTTILARLGDIPAGTAFVGLDGDVAMVHAIEVDPHVRRQGIGGNLLGACADWCIAKDATWLCLAVTRSNTAANALYVALGMTEVARYHYRRRVERAE